jgi:hypothetical protein
MVPGVLRRDQPEANVEFVADIQFKFELELEQSAVLFFSTSVTKLQHVGFVGQPKFRLESQ